jgi:maltooligosyltrehalose trehalohydrolase
MEARTGGWYEATVASAAPGDDYWFILDDRDGLPDPRSPSQPVGVNGPSRLVNHDSFRWRHDAWQVTPVRDALFYELHVGTFSETGTFEGAIDHLRHLVDLGITHVELMPVNEFSGTRGWGYDSVDLYAPHHAYGGPDALKRLIDACHERGLAVVADVVYNHFGPVGNYLARFGPYFTDRYSTPWGTAINLDGAGSDEVRRFFCDHAVSMLLDYRFDGLRLDAIHAIFDMSAVHFLEQLTAEVNQLEDRLERPLLLIAESDLNDPRIIRAPAIGGYGVDAQWCDDFHHALHTLLTGEKTGYYADFGSIADMAKAFEQAYVFDGRYSVFRGRHHGRPPTGLPPQRFIVYLQDHDQVGNRARGDRSGHLMDTARLLIGAALVMTSRFVPMLFQGEEWGASTPFLYFTNHEDPKLGAAVSEGRRHEFAAFGWKPEDIPDPQALETFLRSKLDWSEMTRSPHREILRWHRELIRLRRRVPALTSSENPEIRFDENARWLAIRRGPVAILCNLAERAQTLPCPETKMLLSSRPMTLSAEGLAMPPVSIALLSRE